MSDDEKKSEQTADVESPSGPAAGERLAAARRKQQIPIVEIAKELHLDEYKVRALEANDFDVIGAPVFAKGHLRKYAQLVDVPVDDVMADYYLLDRSHGAPPEISLRAKPRREISPGPWIAALIALLLVAILYWWFGVRTPAQAIVPPTVEMPQTQTPQEPESLPEVTQIAPQSLPQEELAAASAVEETEQEPAPTPEVAVDDSILRMSVTYNGDSWTEVTDANGERLFFNLGSAGQTINLSGEAPFNVLFGNAENVSLSVNNSPYAIAASERRGRTARMTISGSAAER